MIPLDYFPSGFNSMRVPSASWLASGGLEHAVEDRLELARFLPDDVVSHSFEFIIVPLNTHSPPITAGLHPPAQARR
jgi:hypothetical protein